jgi:hypothetical protein
LHCLSDVRLAGKSTVGRLQMRGSRAKLHDRDAGLWTAESLDYLARAEGPEFAQTIAGDAGARQSRGRGRIAHCGGRRSHLAAIFKLPWFGAETVTRSG